VKVAQGRELFNVEQLVAQAGVEGLDQAFC